MIPEIASSLRSNSSCQFCLLSARKGSFPSSRSDRLIYGSLLAHYYPESDQFHATPLFRYLRVHLLLLFTRSMLTAFRSGSSGAQCREEQFLHGEWSWKQKLVS